MLLIPEHVIEDHLFRFCDKKTLLKLKSISQFDRMLKCDGSRKSIKNWNLTESDQELLKRRNMKNDKKLHDFSTLIPLLINQYDPRPNKCQVCQNTINIKIFWLLGGQYCRECANDRVVGRGPLEQNFSTCYWTLDKIMPYEQFNFRYDRFYPKHLIIPYIKQKFDINDSSVDWSNGPNSEIENYIKLKIAVNAKKNEIIIQKQLKHERSKQKILEQKLADKAAFAALDRKAKQEYRKNKMIQHLNEDGVLSIRDIENLTSYKKFINGIAMNVDLNHWTLKFINEKNSNV
jgi:hypothetical protein